MSWLGFVFLQLNIVKFWKDISMRFESVDFICSSLRDKFTKAVASGYTADILKAKSLQRVCETFSVK